MNTMNTMETWGQIDEATADAIAFLESRGLTLRVHFVETNAVEKAAEVAWLRGWGPKVHQCSA
jgi:hypothetical protein